MHAHLNDYVRAYIDLGYGLVKLRSNGKIPITKEWQKHPIRDVAQFNGHTGNLGVQLGQASGGLIDVDLDCAEAIELAPQYLPPTPAKFGRASKPRSHWLYQAEGATPAAKFYDNYKKVTVELRGDHSSGYGGQTAFPPSIHPSSEVYEWDAEAAPPAVIAYGVLRAAVERLAEAVSLARGGPMPAEPVLRAKPQNDGRLVSTALNSTTEPAPPETPYEINKLWDVLHHVGPDGRRVHDPDCAEPIWKNVLMAIAATGWTCAVDLADQWSAQAQREGLYHGRAEVEQQVLRFAQKGREGLTERWLYKQVIAAGWIEPAASTAQPVLPGAVQPLQMPFQQWELTQGGVRKSKSYVNARNAIVEQGFVCTHDVFHDHKFVNGADLTDAVSRAVRDQIIGQYRFDPGVQATNDALDRTCEAAPFHPVKDYFATLQWDGVERLDTWLIDYLGAADTPFNRAVGRLPLLAAVRRIHVPGTKFDHVLILVGPQRRGKSTALRLMAIEEANFSDQDLLHANEKQQQERTKGILIYEIAELAGLRRTEREKIKAFLSRMVDRDRPAYGRFIVRQPRSFVPIATTNDEEFLTDPTGNTRFWPVAVDKIDLEGLAKNRDQIWAEAVHKEKAKGASLSLPPSLYEAARQAQEERMEADPWEDDLQLLEGDSRVAKSFLPDGAPIITIRSYDVFDRLQITPDKKNAALQRKVSEVMRRLGWQGPKRMYFTVGSETPDSKDKTRAVQVRGYWKEFKLSEKSN